MFWFPLATTSPLLLRNVPLLYPEVRIVPWLLIVPCPLSVPDERPVVANPFISGMIGDLEK